MKNILARGGIEFIAVLLGITGSLIIDNRRTENDIQDQLNGSLNALIGELNENIQEFDRLMMTMEVGMPYLDRAIKAENLETLSSNQLDSIFFRSSTPWGRPLNTMVFKSLESSGLIYNIRVDSLRRSILNLYEKTYTRYQFIIDYELNDIKKLDDVLMTDFIYRDDKNESVWFWPVDWNNPINIDQFRENHILRNYYIINRSNKQLLKNVVPNFKRNTEVTIKVIEKYLSSSYNKSLN